MILHEIAVLLLLLSGSILIMLGALGVLRFVDPLCRSHALGKASSLGICLMLAGLWVALNDEITGLKILLVMIFSLITIPMASHLVSLYIYNIQDTEVTLKPDGIPEKNIGLTTSEAPEAVIDKEDKPPRI